MKLKRLLAAFLTFVMLFGAVANLSILPVFAANKDEDEEKPAVVIDYMTKVFENPEEKLATMDLMLEEYGYQLYYEPNTGEVAYRKVSTGETIFTNPYDVPASFTTKAGKTASSSKDIKKMLLSQIIVKFSDGTKDETFYSYTEAAERGQIVVKNIKNGIRVEYAIGRQETRKLVPRLISKERFETLILPYITNERTYKRMKVYFLEKNPYDNSLSERAVKEMNTQFPITNKMAVYIFDPDATERDLNEIEQYIKLYCPHYTYESLMEDHMITEYEGNDQDPAVFKMSLEYYLDEDGLTVRLPANGIRFNETSYSLTSIQVLPFMGAGKSDNTGYTFYPDGAGTLVRFEDLTTSRTITGELYGMDYAYHTLASSHMETLRLPVYGLVENVKNVTVHEEEVVVPGYTDIYGDWVEETTEIVTTEEVVTYDRGFLAIVEEGDALAKVTTNHGAFVTHRYNSCYTTFNPRPSDSYNLNEAISVGADTQWNVVSKRKYTGSYRIRFIHLTDDEIAKENKVKDYYECSYVGMAKAYRDYLENNGTLTRLTKETVKDQLPLYIESFGAIDTASTFLSIPITVKTPLTTFENLKTMYTELSEAGISNINFRLTGFANGGMVSSMPYNVKFEKVLGGNEGYSEFIEYAEANDFGVYPDFDIMYFKKSAAFDGYKSVDDAVRTIDNRYTTKRIYDSTSQTLQKTGLLAISPPSLRKFYEAFTKDLKELGISGISVSTLGSDLNSDFNKNEPYNREDAKNYVVDILEDMYENYSDIMVDGGNSYIFKYVSHILNASLDSSRNVYASEMVPFLGMVLHGYINFAGSPTNMAGDIRYEILRIIENGAAPYFTLSYQNTTELKNDKDLAKYYSVAYDIWKEDLIEVYNELNEALGDLQAKRIDDHEFLIGERTPSEKELKEEAEAIEKAAQELAKLEEEEAAKKALQLARENYLRQEQGLAPLDKLEEKVEVKEEVEEEVEEDTGYKYTKYTVDNGSIVKVTYEGGTSFILNYNSFEVTADGYTVPALGYVKIDG